VLAENQRREAKPFDVPSVAEMKTWQLQQKFFLSALGDEAPVRF